ncbi:hypothetical protein KFK09_012009 [Dendrobium nobile]|uniref:Uncharacterized protein n=1 Tax=Dendrobium nobile TaxID=94219 RepID=A0A8T3BE36_DENNO|nr:hypothetical protein KFK09_012008 [Dendrobium nobile]KAI0511379.1 hypothetical protein KFK09_012009 [Dendrobium nobile]
MPDSLVSPTSSRSHSSRPNPMTRLRLPCSSRPIPFKKQQVYLLHILFLHILLLHSISSSKVSFQSILLSPVRDVSLEEI